MTKKENKRHVRLLRELGINSWRGRKRAAVINANGGHGYGAILVWVCRRTRIPIDLLCAFVQQESGFRNVFGHDPVRNPVKKGGKVTRSRYLAYKAWRKAGLGMQGVGLTQLTWFEYQDRADAYGGCWKPRWQVLVAAEVIEQLIDDNDDVAVAIARYNGTGDRADAYAREVFQKRRFWTVKFKNAGVL